MIQEYTAYLIAEVHTLAAHAESQLAEAGQPVAPHLLADVRKMRWAGTAGSQADRVIIAATMPLSGDAGDALRVAITAGLALRLTEFDLGHSSEPYRTSVLDRALTAAAWVQASLWPHPVSAERAVLVFTDSLPRGWQWDSRPTVGDGGRYRFAVSTAPAGGETAIERLTMSGLGPNAVQVEHQRLAPGAKPVTLSWFDVCQYVARPRALRPIEQDNAC